LLEVAEYGIFAGVSTHVGADLVESGLRHVDRVVTFLDEFSHIVFGITVVSPDSVEDASHALLLVVWKESCSKFANGGMNIVFGSVLVDHVIVSLDEIGWVLIHALVNVVLVSEKLERVWAEALSGCEPASGQT
jgi:hypothetical protein